MSYVQKTHLAAAATGYVIDLGRDCGKVTIQTVGAAAFKALSSSVATPTSAYVPTAGNTVDALNLAAGGEMSVGVDFDGAGYKPGLQDPIRYVAVYAVDGGNIRIVGH